MLLMPNGKMRKRKTEDRLFIITNHITPRLSSKQRNCERKKKRPTDTTHKQQQQQTHSIISSTRDNVSLFSRSFLPNCLTRSFAPIAVRRCHCIFSYCISSLFEYSSSPSFCLFRHNNKPLVYCFVFYCVLSVCGGGVTFTGAGDSCFGIFELIGEPVQSLVQSVSIRRTRGLDVPVLAAQ